MKVLPRTQFGNPILREQARQIPKKAIPSREVKSLITNMRYTLTKLDTGVGLAAPQVGQGLALAVIRIRPRKYRKNVKNFDLVMINPKISQTFGRKDQKWEGCISSGPKNASLFAKIPRYSKLKLNYFDEKGIKHNKQFDGLSAQVIQHEVDHLNGVLFVDKIKDTNTFMTFSEYKKRIVNKRTTV
jgi:peptide deformylase